MNVNRRRVLWTLIAVVIVAGLAFVPLKSLICPAWDVWVTDRGGRQITGATVRVTFRNYSAESRSHEVDAITDSQGHARFRAQVLSASLGRRVMATLSSAAAGVHASFGVHASVFAFDNGVDGFAVDERNFVLDWTGTPDHIESRIVVAPPKP
jgi:hypothetical protein